MSLCFNYFGNFLIPDFESSIIFSYFLC